MKNLLRALLPILVLIFAALAARKLVSMRKVAEHAPPRSVTPIVETVPATIAANPLVVEAQGTVTPRLTTRLTSEVAGRVLQVGPAWVAGGHFQAGELLLSIDATDARSALADAEERLASAQVQLTEQEADSDLARREWEATHTDTAPPDLLLHGPQVRAAKAGLDSARALRDRAKRDLARCNVTAPYSGRILSTSVESSEFVQRGAELGRVLPTDRFEVRLLLPDAELAFLDLSALGAAGGHVGRGWGPEVSLSAHFAGGLRSWGGRIVRTEAELDPSTRMLIAVCEIPNPATQGEFPLDAGTFVSAHIRGRAFPTAVSIPREALRAGNRVLVVSEGEHVIEVREVNVLRAERARILLLSGVSAGEAVVISPLEGAVDGLRVSIDPSEAVDEDPAK